MTDVSTTRKKRVRVLSLCHGILREHPDCTGCPLESDEKAWCNVGFTSMIPEDELDHIINLLKEYVDGMKSPDAMRARISYLCNQVTMDPDHGCVGCPYNDDPNSWCRQGKVSNITESQLYEILKKMEEVPV